MRNQPAVTNGDQDPYAAQRALREQQRKEMNAKVKEAFERTFDIIISRIIAALKAEQIIDANLNDAAIAEILSPLFRGAAR
jgi:hypothetical protein